MASTGGAGPAADASAAAASPTGRLGQMRSLIKGFGDLGRKLSFTTETPPPPADGTPVARQSAGGSLMRLLLPNRNPDRYREGFDVVVKIPLKKDPSEQDPDDPDAGSVDMIDGFGGSGGDGEGDGEEDEDEDDPDQEHDDDDDAYDEGEEGYDGDQHYVDADGGHPDDFMEDGRGSDPAARNVPLPLHATDMLPDGETTVKDSEPFPDMPTVIVTDDSDGGLPDHLLGDADLRSEYKRRLSFNAEHQRRLTFKRERAQSDASHKRGPIPPGVAALRVEAAARRAVLSPERSASAGPQDSPSDGGKKLSEASTLRRAPSSPSPAVFQPPGQLRRSQSLMRPSSLEPRPILKARSRDWLDNPKVYKGTGGNLDVQVTGIVERLRDEWRASADRSSVALASAQPPADGRRRRIVFNETVSVIQTFRKTDYIRRPDPNATFLHLNNKVKRVIRQELNEFKREEMLVHEQAFMNTVFH